MAFLALCTQLFYAFAYLNLGYEWIFDFVYQEVTTVALFTILHLSSIIVCIVILFSKQQGIYWRLFASIFLMADIIALAAGVLTAGGMFWPVVGPYLLMFYV